MVRISKQQHRILLTRDTRLVKSKKVAEHILIKANDTSGQMKEVLLRLKEQGVRIERHLRCAKCNGRLEFAGRESVSGDVPDHVLLNSKSFFRCGDCGKVYWEGSHKKSIDEKMRKVLVETDFSWKI